MRDSTLGLIGPGGVHGRGRARNRAIELHGICIAEARGESGGWKEGLSGGSSGGVPIGTSWLKPLIVRELLSKI